MQTPSSIHALLQMAGHPAFCVHGGMITAANEAALARLVPIEEPVSQLLITGQTEYSQFSQGRLCLSLRISGTEYDATVRIVEDFHIFVLESAYEDAQLQVLSLAAQQLRTPLSSMKAMMDHLLPEIPEDTSSDPYLAYLYRAMDQMQRIIYNMSDANRYTTTPARVSMRDVDAFLRELLAHCSALCEHCGIRLEYKGTDAPLYSLIDSERLERSIYNILSNSIKHTQKGGTIQVQLTRLGSRMAITIQDSGKGTDSGTGDLFHRYLREPALEEPSKGLGLGMSLIRSCARSHGGAVLLCTNDIGLRLTMSLQIRTDSSIASPSVQFDYAGDQDHGLIELSDVLPAELYHPKKN